MPHQELQTVAVDSYRRSQSCRKSKQVHRMWLLRSELPVVRLYPSSRQRIVLQREISRLKQSGTAPERLFFMKTSLFSSFMLPLPYSASNGQRDLKKGRGMMKQSTAVLPRTRRPRRHPKRVFWLKLLCVFAAASFAALLVCSPAVAQYLPWKIGSALWPSALHPA